MSEIVDYQSLIKAIAIAMKEEGWHITFPLIETKDYSFTVRKGKICAVVRIRNWKKKVGISEVRRFFGFGGSLKNNKFNCAFLISVSGFSKAAEMLVEHIY